MFGMEDFEVSSYEELQEKMKHLSLRLRMSLRALNFGQDFIRTAGLSVCLVLAAFGAQRGVLSPGDFILVQSYVLQLFQPLAVSLFYLRQNLRLVTWLL